MQIVTDIDPNTDRCPEPDVSWVRFDDDSDWRSVFRQTFPNGTKLFSADQSGAKLSGEFPMVLWRNRAEESQVDLAMRLAKRLPRDACSLVLVAGAGSEFRGHYDRRWECAPGNLHVTVLLRENLPASLVGMGYAILPILALADAAIALASARRVGIKWINDVLLDGGKVGGAISRSSFGGGNYEHAAFGMGLNTTSAPDVTRTVFVPRVASLGNEIGKRTPLALLGVLLSSFASNHTLLLHEGGRALAERYRRLSVVTGKEVCLFRDGEGFNERPLDAQSAIIQGTVDSVTDNLELVIKGKRYASGRLAFAEDLSRAPCE